jgi:hypothetical protein
MSSSARGPEKLACSDAALSATQPLEHIRNRLLDFCSRPLSQTSIGFILLVETFVNLCIVRFVPYTEIDWEAYMQQVGMFQAGELDYVKIKGGTGPLVYPAGFLYIFSALKALIGGASNIAAAQYVFVGVYALNTLVILVIYRQTKLPALSALPLLMSKRIHSIFVLRLFNDCIASLFAHTAILALINCKLKTAATLLSLGVSIKMNVSTHISPRDFSSRTVVTICCFFAGLIVKQSKACQWVEEKPHNYVHLVCVHHYEFYSHSGAFVRTCVRCCILQAMWFQCFGLVDCMVRSRSRGTRCSIFAPFSNQLYFEKL